jgi:hypothetical protein
MGTMIKEKEVKEKEPKKIICAKVPYSLFLRCEEVKDKLRIGTSNEIVERALILFLSAYDDAITKMSKLEDESLKEGIS